MIIDIKSIRQKGLDEEDFSFEYTPDDGILSLPDAKFFKPCEVSAKCEVYPGKAYVSGVVKFFIKASCSRCLAPATYEGSVEYDEEFLPKGQAESEETSYTKDKIDLKPLIEQIIMTNTPFAVYCKPDCKGLCPNCGKNLNDGECECKS